VSEDTDTGVDWGAGPDTAMGWYFGVNVYRQRPAVWIHAIQLPWQTRLSLWWYNLKEQWKAEWRRPDGLS